MNWDSREIIRRMPLTQCATCVLCTSFERPKRRRLHKLFFRDVSSLWSGSGVNKKCKIAARMNFISILVKTTEPNKRIHHITRAAYLSQKVDMFHGMKSVYYTLMNCLLLQDQLIIWPIYFLFFSSLCRD